MSQNAFRAPDAAATTESPRFAFVDIARGAALLAMFVYHFAYDLSFLGLIETDIVAEPGWRIFARCIAGSFLIVVGFSLVLATRKGLNRRAYLNRLALVAGAAALVSLGTWFALRGNFIFFGILHHIALASVLALPFLRLPVIVVVASAILAFALPAFVAHPLLDAPWLSWLGFSRIPLQTADFVPVFPWFGCVLAGIALARLLLPRLAGTALANWRPRALPARIVAWGGRHSLLVYLVHQPVFIALLTLVTLVAPPAPPAERVFRAECQRSCGPDVPQRLCRAVCACTIDKLKREQLWQKTLDDLLTPEEGARLSALAQACLREH